MLDELPKRYQPFLPETVGDHLLLYSCEVKRDNLVENKIRDLGDAEGCLFLFISC